MFHLDLPPRALPYLDAKLSAEEFLKCQNGFSHVSQTIHINSPSAKSLLPAQTPFHLPVIYFTLFSWEFKTICNKEGGQKFCAVQKSPRSAVAGEWQPLRSGRTLLPPASSPVTPRKASAGKRRGNSLGVTREVNLKAAAA